MTGKGITKKKEKGENKKRKKEEKIRREQKIRREPLKREFLQFDRAISHPASPPEKRKMSGLKKYIKFYY